MTNEPIAIIGASCRLPGGISGLDELWTALSEGRDLIGPMPDGRLDVSRFLDPDSMRPGKSYSFDGGYLLEISGFDASYFGVSPREAEATDPQQRILLELAAEAFDDAGLDHRAVAGSDTAVFVGLSNTAYGTAQTNQLPLVDVHTMSGLAASIAANRLSYVFDLHGPSLIVDTACSSAMVAVHQACEAIQTGRSTMALAGAFNLLIDPLGFVGFAKAMMLSPTFRCRPFSADADGYARAEGGGLLVLKRLDAALADGDRVHAVILGSGTNTNGRTTGMALPSSERQAELLRAVYSAADIDPDELVYLEAHGTGTSAGDPAECIALGTAFAGRTSPLPIGSIKSNMGHLETASGIAGLLKAILVLRHGEVPASLHATPLSPAIDFAGLGLAPAVEASRIEPGERPVVGVNSFGFGGANGHVALTAAPAGARRDKPSGPVPVLVSARSPEALADAVAALRVKLESVAPQDFYDLAYTSCLRRTPHGHRVAVLAGSPAEAAERLSSEGAAQVEAGAATGVAFAFSGNGSQWAGMGAGLLDDPVFVAAVSEVDELAAPLLGWSVVEKLRDAADIGDTAIAQPLLFAVQTGLVAMLRESGVEPGATFGHSVGEIAAAVTAGAIDLRTAVSVVVARSRAQARTAGTGRMAAVGLAETAARQAIAEFGGLTLAGVNSPQDVTIAGDAEELRRLEEQLDGVFFRELDLDYAFHSHAMDPIADQVRTGLADVGSREPVIPFVSTVTGKPVAAGELDADYWWRNVREPVLFAQAADLLAGQGIGVVVEIGPHPVLATYLRRGRGLRPVATLTRGSDGDGLRHRVAAGVIAAGGVTDWERYFLVPGAVCDLPRYPWQRETFWNISPELWVRTSGTGVIDHPLLGERMPSLEATWLASVEPTRTPWVADHRIGNSVIMPGTAYVEMALAAGRRAIEQDVELVDLDILGAMGLSWDSRMDTRTHVSLSDEDGVLRIASREGADGEWQLHARGRVRRLTAPAPAPVVEPAGPVEVITSEQFYDGCARSGLNAGPAFRLLTEIRVHGDEVWADYEFTEPLDDYEIHPALLDGALQTGVSLFRLGTADGRPRLPASIGRVRRWAPPPVRGRFQVLVRSMTPRETCWDIVVTDEHGRVAVEVVDCRLRSIGGIEDMLVADDRPVRLETVLRAAPRPDEPVPHWPLGRIALRAPAVDNAFLDACADLDAYFVVRALTGIAGDEFTVDGLLNAGVRRRRQLDMLLGLAERQGALTRAGDTWRASAVADPTWRLVSDFPGHVGDIAMRAWCGEHLADILCGRVDAADLLRGEPESTAYLTDLSPLRTFQHETIRALVRDVVRDWPADRPLRVLEMGGTTAWLPSELPAERTRYVHAESGSEVREQFDLVIAGNGGGADAHPGLLAPGGLLVVAEITGTAPVALTFGLLDVCTEPFRDNGFTVVDRVESGPFAVVLATAETRQGAPAPPAVDGRWVVLVGDEHDRDRADELAAALGTTAVTDLPDLTGAAGAVFVVSGAPADPVVAAARLRAVALVADDLPLWIITRPSGALPAPERPDHPVDAAVWGIGRTIANEHRNVTSRRISWAIGVAATRVVAELLAPDDEDEIVLTGAGRFVPRVVEAARPPHTRSDVPRRLVVDEPNLRFRVVWTEDCVPDPGPDQVVVEVRATALNYRDVMAATGLLPPEAEARGKVQAERNLGLECAGVVVAAGANVTHVAVGDHVTAMFHGSMVSHLVVGSDAVLPIPGELTFVEAATMPVAWFTTHHSLNALAQLQPGETVLVHGAAGGVGFAAIGLAKAVGARVIATAGSPMKRNLLRHMDIEHVLDSRDLAFADEAMRITGGRGVDVVLNSLGGEALTRGLELLAPYGRFVELGKRDIYANARLPMRTLKDNIGIFAVDVRTMTTAHGRAMAARRMRELLDLLPSFDMAALPHRVFPAARAAEAFRLMQRSKHIGKIVITMDEAPVERARRQLELDPEATYLVVGGVSGFGAATVRRLVARGARHVALVSRRGAMTPDARKLVAELKSAGVRVTAFAADVADRAAMVRVFAAFDRPLRGVVHAAMVLDDMALADMDDRAFRTAFDPKLGGAIVLDELTRDHELDFFVVYSSVVTIIGNVRQANYVAGNLALEALTRARRAQGRPGVAIQLGAIGDTGYIARAGMSAQMEMIGMKLVDPERALDVLEDVLAEEPTDVVAAGLFEWGRMREFLPLLTTPRLAGLLPSGTDQTGGDVATFLKRVKELPRAEALRFVADALTEQLASIMRIAPDRIDRAAALDKLGVDSLLAMELLMVVRKKFRYQASMMDLLKGGNSIAGLAELVLAQMEKQA